MRRTSKVVILALLATVSCAPATSPLSKADIAATETTLTEAIVLANKCLALTTGPCTQPAIRVPLIADIHKAHDAFKMLQFANATGQPAAITAFQAAMAQLTAATPATVP